MTTNLFGVTSANGGSLLGILRLTSINAPERRSLHDPRALSVWLRPEVCEEKQRKIFLQCLQTEGVQKAAEKTLTSRSTGDCSFA